MREIKYYGKSVLNFAGYIFFPVCIRLIMMNYIWVFMILFSLICAVFSGNMPELSSAILNGCSDAVSLCIKLLGVLCLWCGLMNVAEKSGLCKVVTRILSPVLKLLFPENRHNPEVMDAISMNVTANLFGLGNAATPLGINAVRKMQKLSNDKNAVTPDMMTFVVINTAALKIIPTTVAALRQSAGAENPMDIIICVWISSAFALVAAVTAVKISGRFGRK